jgi:hypothetical protein
MSARRLCAVTYTMLVEVNGAEEIDGMLAEHQETADRSSERAARVVAAVALGGEVSHA